MKTVEYEVDFDGNVKALIRVCGSSMVIIKAIDGGGGVISTSRIIVTDNGTDGYLELEDLKRLAHEGLPSECIAGCGEIKFCPHRSGEGNKCKQCSDLLD